MVGTVAQTIQGEAGDDPAAQFAVASVIANRVAAGGFGGASASSVVNAPNQFTAGSGVTPGANATALAQAIEQGNLSQYGSTGNALYFQTAGSGLPVDTASGANIGGNVFSDAYGAPTAQFQAPSLSDNFKNFTTPGNVPGTFTTEQGNPGQPGSNVPTTESSTTPDGFPSELPSNPNDPNISITQSGDTSGGGSSSTGLAPGEGDYGGPTGVDEPGTYTLPNPLGAGAGDQIPSTTGSDPTGSGGGATGATVPTAASGLSAILAYLTDKGVRFALIALGILLVVVAAWGFVKGDLNKDNLSGLDPRKGLTGD